MHNMRALRIPVGFRASSSTRGPELLGVRPSLTAATTATEDGKLAVWHSRSGHIRLAPLFAGCRADLAPRVHAAVDPDRRKQNRSACVDDARGRPTRRPAARPAQDRRRVGRPERRRRKQNPSPCIGDASRSPAPAPPHSPYCTPQPLRPTSASPTLLPASGARWGGEGFLLPGSPKRPTAAADGDARARSSAKRAEDTLRAHPAPTPPTPWPTASAALRPETPMGRLENSPGMLRIFPDSPPLRVIPVPPFPESALYAWPHKMAIEREKQAQL